MELLEKIEGLNKTAKTLEKLQCYSIVLFEPELENVMQFQCTALDRTVKLI